MSKTFEDLLNGQELDLSVLDFKEVTEKFEEFFDSEEFQEDFKNSQVAK